MDEECIRTTTLPRTADHRQWPRLVAGLASGTLLAVAVWPTAASGAAYKVTFAVKNATHGQVWNGGVPDPGTLRGMLGWHIHDDDRLRGPDRWDVVTQSVGGNVASPGIILSLTGPESRPFTFFTRRGDTTFVPQDLPYGTLLLPPELRGEVAIERVPDALTISSSESENDSPALLRTKAGDYWLAWVAYKTIGKDGDYLEGADQVMVANSADGRSWSKPSPVTAPGDHFRVKLAEDATGQVWCVYGLQRVLGSGNFDIFARRSDGDGWSPPVQISSDPRPDAFHDVATAPDGGVYVVWAGFRDGSGAGLPQSDILVRYFDGAEWGPERNLTASPEDDWEPSVAVDASGGAWVGWDAYRSNGFDLMLRRVNQDGAGPTMDVSATPFAEMRADVAVDRSGRVWVAWEEGPANWGKDFGYANPLHGIRLKQGQRIYDPRQARTPRIAVFEGGRWHQPARSPTANAAPYINARLYQNPRLANDGDGNVWVLLRHQWRGSGRYAGHLFDIYATTWAGGDWIPPVLLTASTGRIDTVSATAPATGGSLVAAVVGDGRRLPVGLPRRHHVSVMTIDGRDIPGERGIPDLEPFRPSVADSYVPTHDDEDADVARIREHRIELAGRVWKIVRGDLHRHTETSMDGAIDGSLVDAYRYALNAAQLDFLGVSDHNYGQWLDTDEPEDPQSDNEFQFWRAQKHADLFCVPGRFTPLYGYERTPNFPLGHRNIFHAQRGVFSLKVPRLHVRERPGLIDADPPRLWAYLRRTRGIGIPHTTATTMGTDWSRRNDELIPVTEIYQGDRNAYEAQGAPRSAIPSSPGRGQAGLAPHQRGLVQNALGVGYRMGFIASSDHYSTHISYANLIVPDRVTSRQDLMDAFRNRRTYASSDNIVVDFHTAANHQGAAVTAAGPPEFTARVRGTAPILRIEVVKNNRIVYRQDGRGSRNVEFLFRDEDYQDTSMGPTVSIQDWSRPETGIRARVNPRESFYYLRVLQSYSADEPEEEGEIAWSSPIFVAFE
ncbi:MAG: hypothetical protein OXN89_16390 [Bryobacterales bacterium]|nr:hypothetical protein [Bryobacterales bacterium]